MMADVLTSISFKKKNSVVGVFSTQSVFNKLRKISRDGFSIILSVNLLV